jgi:hypothetical protein
VIPPGRPESPRRATAEATPRARAEEELERRGDRAAPWDGDSRIAAAALLALVLGLLTGARIPRAREPDPALRAARDQVARLEGELLRLRAEPRAESGGASPPAAGSMAAEAVAPRPLTNLPVVWLRPSELSRVPARSLAVAPDAALIVLVLQVDDPEPRRRYRLDVQADTGRTVWSGRGLVKTGARELVLALPRTLLAAGGYSFRLHDEAAPETARAEYALRIEPAGAERAGASAGS